MTRYTKPSITLKDFNSNTGERKQKKQEIMFRYSKDNLDIQYVYLDGVKVGTLNTFTKVYIKEVTDEHLFRKFKGYGLSVAILEKIKDKVNKISIVAKDKNYLLPISAYLNPEHRYCYKGDWQHIARID